MTDKSYHIVPARTSEILAEVYAEADRRALPRPDDADILTPAEALSAPLDGTQIVSHLSLRWWRFPFFVRLRGMNPSHHILHVEPEPRRREDRNLRLATYSLFDEVTATQPTA